MGMNSKRRWSMRIEGLLTYNVILAFFWRDWSIWTAAWLFVPYMAVTLISTIGEVYRESLPREEE